MDCLIAVFNDRYTLHIGRDTGIKQGHEGETIKDHTVRGMTDASESARTLDTGEPFPGGLLFLAFLLGETRGKSGYTFVD